MEREAAPGKANCRKETKTGGIKDLHFMYVLNWFGREPNRKKRLLCLAGVFPHHKSILQPPQPCSGFSRKAQPKGRPRCKTKVRAAVCRQLGGGSLPTPNISCTRRRAKQRFLPRCPQVRWVRACALEGENLGFRSCNCYSLAV